MGRGGSEREGHRGKDGASGSPLNRVVTDAGLVKGSLGGVLQLSNLRAWRVRFAPRRGIT